MHIAQPKQQKLFLSAGSRAWVSIAFIRWKGFHSRTYSCFVRSVLSIIVIIIITHRRRRPYFHMIFFDLDARSSTDMHKHTEYAYSVRATYTRNANSIYYNYIFLCTLHTYTWMWEQARAYCPFPQFIHENLCELQAKCAILGVQERQIKIISFIFRSLYIFGFIKMNSCARAVEHEYMGIEKRDILKEYIGREHKKRRIIMLKIKIYYVRVSRIKYTYFNNEQNVAPQHTTFRKSKNAMDLFSFVWCSLVCVALL